MTNINAPGNADHWLGVPGKTAWIGVDDDLAQSAIRFGLGRFNGEDEVAYVAELVVEQVARLKDLNPAGNQPDKRRRVV